MCSRIRSTFVVLITILLVTSSFPVAGIGGFAADRPASSIEAEDAERPAEVDGDATSSHSLDEGGHRDASAGPDTFADGHDDPPTRHLGYGGPDKPLTGYTGGEFSFGTPPVPRENPASLARSADGGADGHVGGDSSIEEFTTDTRLKGLSAALTTATTADGGNPCPDGAPTREFTVHAIQTDIVYNKYGQHDPNGVMYVLAENRDEVLEQVENAPNASIDDPDMNATTSLVQPLNIRAHAGDCIDITFVNELDEHASMHPAGVSYDVDGSDGSAVGDNADSTAAPGDTVQYRWYVEEEGTYAFWDAANQVMHDEDETLRQHGLFGALTVYEPGTEWLDLETGESIRSGVKAMIESPNGSDYREYSIFYHDKLDVYNADGSKPTYPNSDVEQELYALNYRGDPTGARLREDCAECDREDLFYSSWLHGDPGGGDLVFPAYVGDPVKYRVIGAQTEEKHVHHHHGHRWKSETGDEDSNTIDAETLSAGATYTQEFVAGFGQFSERPNMTYEEAFAAGGGGYVQGSPGDYIFHCHLFPHYSNGMWGIHRVFDKDTRQVDDRADLQPLPDRDDPPEPTPEDPGYPNFVPGEEREEPPKAPLSPDREPTALEESAINGSGHSDPIEPGAPYVDPCPDDAPIREYNITTIQLNITYNNAGDYDPGARVYVLERDKEAVLNGEKEPEPLAIRANLGECVEITLNNDLPVDDEPNAMSIHPHYVGYDVLGSDGATIGYNYRQSIEPGEEINYRWYADEQGTIYWHDHASGGEKGMHGTFGALVVEPENSTWLDPETGEPIETGTEAMIEDPNGENHREFVLFFQDFVPLHHQHGELVNKQRQHNHNHGTMGINYANAPFYHRNDSDPAYVYSSWAHGDPMTPILESYPEEPVRIKTLSGTFEEMHNFKLHANKWRKQPNDEDSPFVSAQTVGTSEQFEFRFSTPEENPAGLEVDDYLYGSAPMDDLWNGAWGMVRVYGSEVDHLEPLPGHSAPDGTISKEDLGLLNETDSPPPAAPDPGSPCPADASTRTYNLVAFSQNVTYNDYGDHDPHGVMFATEEDYLDIKAGEKEPEPLVLRANEGDCIEVTLTNELPANMSQHSDHARMVAENAVDDWENSNRVSLHPALLDYLVQYSDGATVGFNYDQTVGPGETITYRWYADEEVGTTPLWDMADERSHRHHGAYGMLIVEPEGSEWLDPKTGEPIETGTRAIIEDPNGEDFREYAVVASDGKYIVNSDGSCPVPPVADEDDPDAPCNQAHGNPEDQGFKSINYRAEPLPRRLVEVAKEHLAFSSDVHGDPATPVFEAYLDDPVRFRYAQTADKSRGITFHLSGHRWSQEERPEAAPTSVSGEHLPGSTADIEPTHGAGGYQQQAGDYYFGATKLLNYVEGGLWGIFRVHDEPAAVQPLPDRRPAAPTNLTVETPAEERTLELEWDDHSNPDVEGYNVYRSAKSGGPYTKVNDELVVNSSYRDDGLLPGTTYYYVVTAVDAYGQESAYSGEAEGTTNPLLRLEDETDDLLDDPVRGEIAVDLEADSEAELDDVEFRVKDGPTEVRFDVDGGEIETSGDAVAGASMDPENATYTVDWNTDAEADGDLDVDVRAKDLNGGTTKRPKKVHVDNTDPEFETELDGTTASNLDVALNDDATLDINATDGDGSGVDVVSFRIDDDDWQTITDYDGDGVWETTIDTTKLTDGDHELKVKVTDGAGNVRKKTHPFAVDNTDPEFDTYIDGTLISLLDAALSGDVTLEVDAEDGLSGVDGVAFELDDNGWNTVTDADGDGVWETTIDTTKYGDGSHTLKVKTVDKAGNAKVKKYSIEIDNLL